jgi:enamine deaminase RidA (YjgF/YER057c/UK114 family)
MGIHAAGPLLLAAIALALPMLESVSDCTRTCDVPRTPGAQLPAGAVRSGNTLYLTVRPGSVTGSERPPCGGAAEARLLMDAVARTVAAADMRMDDLVSVTVISTDDTSNGDFDAVYRSYFHSGYPAPGFVKASTLAGGAHFELLAVAIKPRWLRL